MNFNCIPHPLITVKSLRKIDILKQGGIDIKGTKCKKNYKGSKIRSYYFVE